MPALGGQCFESANDNDQRNEHRFERGRIMAKGKVDGWREGRLSAHVTKPHLHDNSTNTHGKFGNVILL